MGTDTYLSLFFQCTTLGHNLSLTNKSRIYPLLDSELLSAMFRQGKNRLYSPFVGWESGGEDLGGDWINRDRHLFIAMISIDTSTEMV
jgi:hypothetical protein